MTMKIETIELTVPQRRLMEIFANTQVKGDYGDQCVRALLEYMREQLQESNYSSPTLNAMLDGTLPVLNFSRYFDMVMCEVYNCDTETAGGIPPEELPMADYRDALLNCFPKIFYDMFSEPVKDIDPRQNLLITWIMWYGDKIKRELENIYGDELKSMLSIIYEYIWVCSSGWPEFHQHFLSRWTHYLLTHEWPDKETFFHQKWQTEKRLREAFQITNTHLAAENQILRDSQEERYITVMDAARAVLRVLYGQDNVDKEADALRKRISRNNPDMPIAFTGKQGRTFYSVETLISCFQAEKSIGLTAGQIATAIRADGLPKGTIGSPTRTKAGQ